MAHPKIEGPLTVGYPKAGCVRPGASREEKPFMANTNIRPGATEIGVEITSVARLSASAATVAARAFVLIEAHVGSAPQVVQALRTLTGVRKADVITGNFDIIALVEAANMAEMAELVTGQIQGIRGVSRTITCVATS